MLYQGGNMTPIEGTDIIRFNKDAGLAPGYGSDINKVNLTILIFMVSYLMKIISL